MNNATTAAQYIRNYWDWRALSFDGSSAQQQSWWQVYDRALGATGPLRILDVGTGTGFIALGLARGGHRVTGLDISSGMLRQAGTKVTAQGLTLTLLAADAIDPPFTSASFDAIVCRNLLWTLPEPARALRCWHRLIRPGGRIIVSDGIWRRPDFSGLVTHYTRLLVSALRKGRNSIPVRFELAYQPIRRHLPHFCGVRAAEAEDLLTGCGFTRPVRHEHHFPHHPYPAGYGSHFFVMSAVRP